MLELSGRRFVPFVSNVPKFELCYNIQPQVFDAYPLLWLLGDIDINLWPKQILNISNQ